MGKLVIREIRAKDAKKALAILKEILRTSEWLLMEPGEGPKSVNEELTFIKKFQKSKNSHLAVAELNGKIVGIVSAEGGTKKRNCHVAVLGISVREEWRGQGIGRALMKYITLWAKNAELKKLRLCVIDRNRQAYKLYQRMGFKKEGFFKREIRIGQRYLSTIEMAKFL